MTSPRLAHLWREYAQTLHGITTADAQGKPKVTAWRATPWPKPISLKRPWWKRR